MGIADELQKLEELHTKGTLNDEEFARAKTNVLANPSSTANVEVGSFLESQLAEVRFQNELARIDREWEIESLQYYILGRRGRGSIPTVGSGVVTGLVGGIAGVFWTVLALTFTSASSHFGVDDARLTTVQTIFPLFGLLFIVVAVGSGIYRVVVAQNYRRALHAYQSRRRKIEATRNGG